MRTRLSRWNPVQVTSQRLATRARCFALANAQRGLAAVSSSIQSKSPPTLPIKCFHQRTALRAFFLSHGVLLWPLLTARAPRAKRHSRTARRSVLSQRLLLRMRCGVLSGSSCCTPLPSGWPGPLAIGNALTALARLGRTLRLLIDWTGLTKGGGPEPYITFFLML
jgi:hypothetical protein